MALLFTQLNYGPTGRARALRLVHDGKCPAPPDTYMTVGAISRVYSRDGGGLERDATNGMILKFREDAGDNRPYFVWWEGDVAVAARRPDPASRLVRAATLAFETVGRTILITIMDGGDA